MNLNKSTRYALYAAMEMTRVGPPRQVTVAQVAERYGIPASVLAKVFQQLVRAGLAVGTRGSGGGYTLARPPASLSVLDVIEVFQPARNPQQCLLSGDATGPCHSFEACRLRRLCDEVEDLARCTYASVTLETLASPQPLHLGDLRAAE